MHWSPDIFWKFPEGLHVRTHMSESEAPDISWNYSCQPPPPLVKPMWQYSGTFVSGCVHDVSNMQRMGNWKNTNPIFQLFGWFFGYVQMLVVLLSEHKKNIISPLGRKQYKIKVVFTSYDECQMKL